MIRSLVDAVLDVTLVYVTEGLLLAPRQVLRSGPGHQILSSAVGGRSTSVTFAMYTPNRSYGMTVDGSF